MTPDEEQAAAAAALADLPLMTVGRLGALLRSHDPLQAWRMLAGEARPAAAAACGGAISSTISGRPTC